MARELAWPESTATWTEEEYSNQDPETTEAFNGEDPEHYTNWPEK